jgi:4-alpha-glucanotransferase
LGGLPFIAEDLGLITPEVGALRDRFCLPGMRVLQFAFDGKPDNPHLPTNYVANTVVYTGTHDNATTRGWFEELPERQRQNLRSYLKQPTAGEFRAASALIELAWSSVAALAMVPFQDILNLGNEARMNIPGRPGDNWCWRCTEDELAGPVFEWLHEVTESSNRGSARAAG